MWNAVATGDREQIGVYRPRIEERSRDLEVERPRDVKDHERLPSLDAGTMDIRQRQNAREEGRAIERMDPSRAPRTDESVGRVEKQGTREDRVFQRPRTNSDERPVPAERQRRFNRDTERMQNSGQGRDSERRSTPNIDRPSTRTAPEGQSSSRREKSDGGRSAPGQRSDGERRGRR